MAPPPFNSSNVMLVYGDIQDLTGSYTIQADSAVHPTKINLGLKNEAGKELIIFADIATSFNTDYQVTGSGSWN